jgi:hypothetical protein
LLSGIGKGLLAQPSLGIGPRRNLVFHKEPIEVIAEPHVEAGVVETPRN